MSSIILPHRWRQQPQGPVEIDLGNPLCQGIRVVWSGATPDHIWYQGSWRPVASKTAGVTPGISTAGRSSQTTTSSTDQIDTGLTADQVLPTTGVTLGFVRRNLDTTARSASLAGYADSATARSIIHAPFSDGNAYWDFGNQTAGSGRLSIAFSKTATVENLAFVAGATKGREIWRNGRKIANNTSATATRASSSTAYWLMRYGGVGSVNADTQQQALFVSWWRELSDAELVAWNESPWQIFRPLTRRIWVSVAGGSGAVLQADAAAIASATAALSTAIQMSGSAQAQATATAALSTGISLQASAQAQASASASLAGQAAALAASAIAQAQATATLTTAISLTAAAGAQASASGSLTTAIRLAAAAVAQAQASASLTAGPALSQTTGYSVSGAARSWATSADQRDWTTHGPARNWQVMQ